MNKNVLGNKTKRCLNGDMVVSIKCYPKSFEITLNILKDFPKGTRLEAANEKMQVNLVTQKDIFEKISISRTVSYKKDKKGNILPINITVSFKKKNGTIGGYIIVSPEFYLSLAMLKSAQRLQIPEKDFPIEIHPRNPRPSPSEFVPYTTARPFRAYRG